MSNNYILIEDAVDAINTNADDLEQNGGIPFAQGARAMAIVVEQIPPADVAPVVRCKDCRYRVDPDKCCHPDGLLRSKDSTFCSYGERREE